MHAYLNERQVPPVQLAGVDPAVDPAAAAHARVRDAALDPLPRLVVRDPVLQPAGVVPDPVLPVPGPGHGGGGAPVGDGERERGGHEHADEDHEDGNDVHPEERRGAAARAGQRQERQQEERGAQRHGGHPHQALALGRRLRQDVGARADERHGGDEGDKVQGAQDAVGEAHHGSSAGPYVPTSFLPFPNMCVCDLLSYPTEQMALRMCLPRSSCSRPVRFIRLLLGIHCPLPAVWGSRMQTKEREMWPRHWFSCSGNPVYALTELRFIPEFAVVCTRRWQCGTSG